MTRLRIIPAALLAALGLAAAAHGNTVNLTAGLENQHPAAYYKAAALMFEDGDKDQAVFWFYAGQLRYRAHLACHPDLKPDGDPALFASLSESVGRPINEYAFGDPSALAASIGKVLDWDAETVNGFTSKTDCAEAIETTRTGLAGLRDEVLARQDEIRSEREKNGLPNR